MLNWAHSAGANIAVLIVTELIVCNIAYSVDITCLTNIWIFTSLISSLDYF